MEYLDNYVPQFEYEYYGWQKENRFLYETEENESEDENGEIQS